MLTKVSNIYICADCHTSGGRFGLAGKDFEKRRFPRTVNPDNGNFVEPFHHTGDTVKYRLFRSIGRYPDLAQIFKSSDVVSAARWISKTEAHGAFFSWNFDSFDLLQLLDPGLHLGCMGSTCGKAGDKLFFFGQHILLPFMRGDQLLKTDITLPFIEIIISAIRRYG